MPLIELELSIEECELSSDAQEFVLEALQRVTEFSQHKPDRMSGFIPCGFKTVAKAIQTIRDQQLSPGRLFCEWGSGFGAIASLATIFGFDASGIEIDPMLVDEARQLASDFNLSPEFIHGSFIPQGGEHHTEYANDDFYWLVTESDSAYEELGLGPDDFDLIFAYPWPGEERVVEGLFEDYAAQGALLLTYNQFDAVRLRRKVSNRLRNRH